MTQIGKPHAKPVIRPEFGTRCEFECRAVKRRSWKTHSVTWERRTPSFNMPAFSDTRWLALFAPLQRQLSLSHGHSENPQRKSCLSTDVPTP